MEGEAKKIAEAEIENIIEDMIEDAEWKEE
jgi:hypothetical protein